MVETTRSATALRIPPSPTTNPPAAQPIIASKRSPIHPEDVHFSRAWFALTALGAGAGLAIIRRFGWRGALLDALTGAGVLAYATLVEPRMPKLERLELHFPNLPVELDGLRIGQISDSHLGVRGAERALRWAVRQMQREQPDMIGITGDIVHGEGAVRQIVPLLRDLHAPLGVYAVPGNHDYWAEFDHLNDALAEVGVPLLMNEHRRLNWHGGELWIVGTDDVWDGTPDLDTALHGVPLDAFTVLLAHTPYGAPQAARLGIGLQLSGHTHGGHMRLPLLGPLARPRYTDRFIGGLYELGATKLYVSRGVGGVPLRLFCRPEAAIVTLRRSA